MTYHRNPCGICGEFDHLSSECFFADPSDFAAEPETIEVRKPYTPSPEFLAFCEAADQRARAWGLPTVDELSGDHPVKRRAA